MTIESQSKTCEGRMTACRGKPGPVDEKSGVRMRQKSAKMLESQ